MTNPLSLQRAALCVALAMAALAARPAYAVNKDLVQIQTQLQALQDAVARLQQSNDERMGVLKDLVQQSADSVNKMAVTIDSVQKQIRTQQEATGSKLDGVSGQVQSLNDSVDEIKARLNRLDKALQDLTGQQQSINAALQTLATTPPAAATASPATGAPGANPSDVPPATVPPPVVAPQAPIVNRRGLGRPDLAAAANPVPEVPTAVTPVAPLAADLFKTALSDYVAAKFSLASSEFSDVIRVYPQDPYSGNAYYYLGEIDYRMGKYPAAIKDYDHVIEQFPDNSEVRVSHYHKAQALFQLKQDPAAIAELRSLITRFPTSPEANLARSKLTGMGVPIVPKRP